MRQSVAHCSVPSMAGMPSPRAGPGSCLTAAPRQGGNASVVRGRGSIGRLMPSNLRRGWSVLGRGRSLIVRLRCIDGLGRVPAASPPCSDSRRNSAIRSPGAEREPGAGAFASFCASFLVPNFGDFFPCRQFRVFPVRSACGRRPYGKGSPNTGRPGGMGPLPGCTARTGQQGSARPGRGAAGRAFPIGARSHAGDAPARCERTPRLRAPLP